MLLSFVDLARPVPPRPCPPLPPSSVHMDSRLRKPDSLPSDLARPVPLRPCPPLPPSSVHMDSRLRKPDSLPSGLWPSCSSASSRRQISPICPIGPIRLIAERERILAHIKSGAKVIKKMHICKSFLFFICIYAFFLLPLPSLLVFGNKLRPPTLRPVGLCPSSLSLVYLVGLLELVCLVNLKL